MSAKRIKSTGVAKAFNEKYPIGTKVCLKGITYKTWSKAGLNYREEAAVFLDTKDIPEPVPLDTLEINGQKFSNDKRRKK